ncbi:hypothetical protein BH09BAC5_BH09BAC5_29010 [soil metagenome]
MKKNDWLFLLTVLMYSILFWKQLPGLNFLIFTSVLLAGQIFLNREILRNRRWILAAIGSLCSAICVYYYGNPLGIFSTFVSLMLCSYFAFAKNGSVIIGGFSSFISIAASIGFMIVRIVERKTQLPENPTSKSGWKKILLVIFALIITLIFFFMYRDSSLLFYNLTQKINFDWISFGWISFTILGALVTYGFYFHRSIPGLIEMDEKTELKLNPVKEANWADGIMSIDSERFSGIVLMSLLNIMLLFVNGLDVSFIFGGNTKLPQGISCMQYVHQGVGTLIVSIIFAMLIILYYFRGRMNFAGNGKILKTLALIWIVQNAFMLFSTAWRNEVYVLVFGLTYKRIGVYIYLILALIGLIVTAWKVQGKKTNAFLVRMNSWLFYGVLVIACFINWDAMIFNNNTTNGMKPDLYYLNSLSNTILPELVDYSVKHPQETISSDLRLQLPDRTYLFLCKEKFIEEENKWPSFVLKSNFNLEELARRNSFGTSKRLNVGRSEMKSIYYFPGFSNVISLEAENNDLTSVGEAGKFPELKVLDVSFNKDLISLSGLEMANQLQYLNLIGTSVSDFSPILSLKNLEHVIVDAMSEEWQQKLHAVNPDLEINIQ